MAKREAAAPAVPAEDGVRAAEGVPAGEGIAPGGADIAACAPAEAGAEVGQAEPSACRRRSTGVRKTGPGANGTGRSKAAGATAKPRKRKARRRVVRWSAKREGVFLDVLAATGNVREAVRASELSETNVYRMRGKSEDFRAKWAVALREGFAKLEALMLERALAGTEKPVWHGGKQVGSVHGFDNRLCLALLAAHRGSVKGEVPTPKSVSEAEMRAVISERLAEMNRRMGGAG